MFRSYSISPAAGFPPSVEGRRWRRGGAALPTLLASVLVFLPASLPAADAPPAGGSKELLRSRNPELKLTWRQPVTSLPRFTQILLPPTVFSYRLVPPMVGTSIVNSSRTEFPVSQKNRDRLAREFGEVLREELGKRTGYTITDKPGPGVLVVNTEVADIVSRVPPEPAGRSEVYIDSVGDGTLIVRLTDPGSGEVFAEAADRRTAEPALNIAGFGHLRAVPPYVWDEVRRLARRWSVAIGDRLDQLAAGQRADQKADQKAQ